jgi:hypothetical protein
MPIPVTGVLGDRPAVLARKISQQARHECCSAADRDWEVVPAFVELEVAVPRLSPAMR